MPIEVLWIISCDYCHQKATVSHTFEYPDQATTYNDEWGRGVPDGWIEVISSEGRLLFFNGELCLRAWILKNEGPEALKAYNERE